MVSCVAEFPAAKLTKYLECKDEEASLLAMCRGARVSSDRFARNFASSKESLRIRRREVGAMACLSAATLATQIHPDCLPPPPLFVTVSRIPLSLTDPTVCKFEQFSLTDPTVCNFCTIPPTSENLGSSPLRPEVKFDKFTRSGAEREL